MNHIPKTEQEPWWALSAVSVKSIKYFLLPFFILWFLLTQVFPFIDNDTEYFLSEKDRNHIHMVGGVIISFTFLILYLVFVTKDNTLKKLWKVVVLSRRSFNPTPEEADAATKICMWVYTVIFTIYFWNPSSYSSFNALYREKLFEGSYLIKESEVPSYDSRYMRISVTFEGKTFSFEGNQKEIAPLIGKTGNIEVYQGIFFKYALVKKETKNVKK